MKKSILLVDDDPDIIEFLKYNFIKENYVVYTASNGEEAMQIAIDKNPSVIVIDIMMPGMDGISLCEALSNMSDKVTGMKVILSARGEDFSQIAGFNSGADDFVVKPINPKVLIKRIEALLRRGKSVSSSHHNKNELIFSDIKIDTERYIVYKENKEIILPRKEFNLLMLLASNPGKVFHREEIYDKIWGDSFVGDRTIDVHIRKLREKIGEDKIITIKGVGYKFNI